MNSCNGCSLCCYLFPIPELNKPHRTKCVHQCADGCAIHNQPRHAICTEFKCLWLKHNWSEELRPDKCGVIMHHIECGFIYIGYALHPWSYTSPAFRRRLDSLKKAGNFVVLFSRDVDNKIFPYGFFDKAKYRKPKKIVDYVINGINNNWKEHYRTNPTKA
jgi:hypothetical protein